MIVTTPAALNARFAGRLLAANLAPVAIFIKLSTERELFMEVEWLHVLTSSKVLSIHGSAQLSASSSLSFTSMQNLLMLPPPWRGNSILKILYYALIDSEFTSCIKYKPHSKPTMQPCSLPFVCAFGTPSSIYILRATQLPYLQLHHPLHSNLDLDFLSRTEHSRSRIHVFSQLHI